MSIQVANITKKYGDQFALKNVSFSIEKGEIVGFLGPNGAGKSTMMKILTTYLKPNEGNAIVNNYTIGNDTSNVQKSIGYLAEHNPLYLDMYVREYLLFNAEIYKAPKGEVENIIEMTGLTSEAHKKIEQLSKGYRQRVGLANALLHNPEVLILDEPTTGLDPNQLIDIRNLIKNVGKEKTVLLSTHIMQEVEAICDRVIIINKGEIVVDEKLKDLSNKTEQIIEVEFDYRVEIEALKSLPEVLNVLNSEGNKYQFYYDTQRDHRGDIFDYAQKNGLKILQLNTKNETLEKLFVSLTTQK